MTIGLTVALLGVAVGLAACNKTRQPSQNDVQQPPQTVTSTTPHQTPSKPLAAIDLTKICNLAPKGRVQDADYNNSDVVEDLIANGKESIPFLITKLDDRTPMPCHVEDYWPQMVIADVAFIVLSDFSTDSTWTKEMIPGTGWDEIFEAKIDPKEPGYEYYYRQIRKRGRGWMKAKWEKIWATYKDRIVWDEKERSFKVV